MTPRTLDWRSLQAKLRQIQDLLDDLRDLGPFDVERLGTDRLATLAAERILTLGHGADPNGGCRTFNRGPRWTSAHP